MSEKHGHHTPSANDEHKKPDTVSNTNLQPPLHLSPLDTPNSTSSLTYTPSDLMSPVAALENISVTPSNETRRSTLAMQPNDNPLDAAHFASSPLHDLAGADVHGKLANETPRFSKTEAVKASSGAFIAGKSFQKIVGLQKPEPFVKPPEMPRDLEKNFIEGLGEYGMDVGVEGMGYGGGLERIKLEGIREEMESPVMSTYLDVAGVRTEEDVRIDPPVSALRVQATTDSGRRQTATRATTPPPPSFESDSANDTKVADTTSSHTSSHTHGGFDFDSRTILAASQSSRTGSSTSVSHSSIAPTRDSAAAHANVGSFAQALDYGGDQGRTGAGYRSSRGSTGPFALSQHNAGATPADVPLTTYAHGSANSYGIESTPQRSGSAPIVLFPSPRVEALSWDFIQKHANFAPQGSVPSGYAPGASAARGQFPTGLFGQQQMPHVPEIMVQSPSPKKMPESRKRAPSSTIREQFGPPLARARVEDGIGLPTLPTESEALWKFKFPGNTHGLLTTLLIWSHAMRSCYNRHPDSKTFPFNPAFPFPISPPVYKKLVSVSFYDTSVYPHKEIRFLGPGDVADIVYGEVDTFRSEKDLEAFQELRKQNCKLEAMKKVVGIDTSNQKDIRNIPMHHRAATGEGRWAYILINGRAATKEETPPHVMLAFHISAMTDTSSCLHTLFPDNHPAPSTLSHPPPKPALKRFGSLQNLISSSRNPLRMHQALRSASSSELPQGSVASRVPQEGGQTLRRTVVKLDKAGSVPLIEGFRVDVQAFRGWLDAVGRGTGKVVMWREKD